MGKLISKIAPKKDPTRHFDLANKAVSRKVLYRRLQSPQSYYERSSPGYFDFVAYNWPWIVGIGLVMGINYYEKENGIPQKKLKIEWEKSAYELIRDGIRKELNEIREARAAKKINLQLENEKSNVADEASKS